MFSMKRPVPEPTEATLPYWQAAADGRLSLPYCLQCARYVFYPRRACPGCLREDTLQWRDLSGFGRVYSYTVVRQAMHPAFAGDVPYVYALIELREGVRLASWVVDCRIEEVAVDMEVEVTFEQPEGSRYPLPKFRPV